MFAKKDFRRGEFLLEYAGECISAEQGQDREKNYPINLGSYLFFFYWNKKEPMVSIVSHLR